MANKTIWNNKKIKYLKENYKTKSLNAIAADLGCCSDTVQRKAEMLGLIHEKKNLPRGYENGKWQNFIEAARAQTGLPIFKKGKEWKKYCEQKKIQAN